MANPTHRKNSRDAVNGGNRALDLSYNDRAGALKVLDGIKGELAPLLNSAVSPVNNLAVSTNVELGSYVTFFNDTTATLFAQFFATKALADAATVDGNTGIAIAGKQYITLMAGNNNWVKTSAACYGYKILDDTYLG